MRWSELLSDLRRGQPEEVTCCPSLGAPAAHPDLEAIGRTVTDKKVVIGVIDHHTLQIERPDQVGEIIREALKHIPPARMVISSDCGMGREGMGRRHAQYKMVAMVVRRSLRGGLTNPTLSIGLGSYRSTPSVNAIQINGIFLDDRPKNRSQRGVLHRKLVKSIGQCVYSGIG